MKRRVTVTHYGITKQHDAIYRSITQFIILLFVFFFFSSRRRHTRLQGDWSSDVCSSDLALRNRASGSVGDGNGLHGHRRCWIDRRLHSGAASRERRSDGGAAVRVRREKDRKSVV